MPNILVVDDSSFQRNHIRAILESEGYTVTEAENGKKALELALETPFDCILLDLLMPVLTGVETLRLLHARAAPAPVIVVTADTQNATREQCIANGARTVFNKPVGQKDLLDLLEKTLNDDTGTETT